MITVSKEMYKTHVTWHYLFRLRKSNKVTYFRKECNELLVICYLILGVTVPLQLLGTAVENVMKMLLVTTASN
jgi:hypothetical protein